MRRICAPICAAARIWTARFRALPWIAAARAIWTWLVSVICLMFPVVWAAHLIFTRLIALCRDAAASRAFTLENAARLKTVAWALLAVNVIDLAYGQISVWASKVSGEYFGWTPAVTGWFAVLLLFLLANVFREGAAMREDLEGTV